MKNRQYAILFHKFATKLIFIPLVGIVLFIYKYILFVHSSGKTLQPLTIHTNKGRLGNQMYTFATLLGLSTLNGRQMALLPKNYNFLSKYFDIDYPVVHVRRSDYLKPSAFLKRNKGREVDGEYFRRAVQYFTDKYKNVAFLAVSDDRKWCEDNVHKYGINVVPRTPSAIYDMALLVECNHTIMTYGSFGFWSSYLSGGDVVYFTDYLKPGTQYMKDHYRVVKKYPEEWVGISTTPPGYWEK